ncbi:MAG: hypothetical protein H0V80_14805 [Acidobacteria bacterium]|nr:hypothetical protein [Acidobacteriota bacterium]
MNARWLALLGAGGAVLVLLAIGNAAGYRYGVADQAFYIPSIQRAVTPSLFPRDTLLLDAQSRLMVTDEIAAWVVVSSGVALPSLMLAGYVGSLGMMFTAAWLVMRRLARSPWTAAAGCLALTLRHRITKTGANSFEGYFHPRVAAFACGVSACAALAHGRLAVAWGLVALSVVLHPTTGLWWVIWLGAATWVVKPRWRRAVTGAVVAVAAVAIAALAVGPLAGRLVVMDAAWLQPFATKDYVFPTDWSVGSWLVNLLLPAVVVAVWHRRRHLGLAAPWEAGAVAGVVVLVAAFLLSLPLIAADVALAVQLQTSRVFWIVDLFAVLGAVWLLAEGVPRSRPLAVALILLLASSSRAVYSVRVEHPERRVIEADLVDGPWRDVGAWLATHTPPSTHVLADPDHDWKFGHSVRLTALRDVLVEGVKDAAVSLYDRQVAVRVQERLEAIGDFGVLDAPGALALARRFDLDVLVIDRDLPLPELYRNARFRVYRLR